MPKSDSTGTTQCLCKLIFTIILLMLQQKTSGKLCMIHAPHVYPPPPPPFLPCPCTGLCLLLTLQIGHVSKANTQRYAYECIYPRVCLRVCVCVCNKLGFAHSTLAFGLCAYPAASVAVALNF